MRTEWEHGWWESASAKPHPSLRSAVIGDYLGWTEQSDMVLRRREVASTIVPLIINFGPSYRLFSGADGAGVRRANGVERSSFVAGLYDTWAAVEGATTSCALQVNFTPFASFQLLRTPLSLLHNGSAEFTELFGREGAMLVERLGNAVDWPARFALLDGFLRARVSSAPTVPAEVVWCWDALESSHGRMAIADLVAYTQWSPRRLINAFRLYAGLPPRTIAGLCRFAHAVKALDAQTSMAGRWSALALDCGYADQSHLIRDFSRFAGCTPTAYLRGRLASGGGVVALGDGDCAR